MNKYKNEKIIKIRNIEFLLRPTFENCVALEHSIELSLNELAMKLAKAKFPYNTDCVKVIYHCQVEKKYSEEDIWQLCMGIWANVMSDVLIFIGNITAGDSINVEKKEEPQELTQ